jgi:hypothetical protein
MRAALGASLAVLVAACCGPGLASAAARASAPRGAVIFGTARALLAEAPSTASPAGGSATPGSLRLTLQRVHGRPGFAVVGERIIVHGAVFPYLSGQSVAITVYRDGRRVLSRQVPIRPAAHGAGQLRLIYASPRSGLVVVRAKHLANPQLGGFFAAPASVRYYDSRLAVGSAGPAVRLLQDELARLRYEVPVGGYFDAATGRAVLALRKMLGLERIETTESLLFSLLQRGAGGYRVRFPQDGNHVEADLTKQVLVEVERGRVRRVLTMSSGKPSTPTVIGHFHVYSKTPGTNSEGMVDSNYFIRGYAVHGYAEVPPYAASHGCLRIPIPNAAGVFAWVQVGYAVDVYTEDGRGSRVVRANAGP